jgi:NitT/TauT family transport system substrate-binding protein
MRPKYLTILAAVVLAGALGCSSGSGTPSTGAKQPVNITVAAIESVTATGLYVAAKQGYFTQAGLHVTIDAVSGSGPTIPDLGTGRVQVVFGNYVSDILADASGVAGLRFIAAGNVSGPGEQEVVVLPGSPVASPAGLRGKIIGVNALDNVGTMMIDAILAANGVPASSVHFVAIPFPEMAAALAAHRIDAAYMSDPFITAARAKYGVRTVFDCDQGAVANLPIAGYVTTSAWAASNQGTVTAFVAALEKGQALAGTDRAAADAALEAYTGVSAKVVAKAAIGTFPVDQQVQAAPLQRLADLMQRYGLLKQAFNVTAMT